MELTQKQENFVQGLFSGLSQRQAYIAAYNSEKMKDNTIDRKAYDLNANGKIKARLQELRDSVSSENILTEIELQEFWSKIVKDNHEGKAVEMKDMLKASELLGKNKSMFTEKIEVTGGIEITIKPPNFGGDGD